MSDLREAVSIIFQWQDEVFTIVRQNFLKTYPGYTAFIGGKVDTEDKRQDDPITPINNIASYLLRTVYRETQEEVGIELERLIETGMVLAIDYIGNAISPHFNPHRFNTYFFRVHLKEKIAFTVDPNEVMISSWARPKVILEQWARGECMMVPPIRAFLIELDRDIYFKKPLNFENRFEYDKEVPWVESIHGLLQLMPLSNTVPPATRTNAFLIGETKKVLIDPSPKNEEEYAKLLYNLRHFKIAEIFITHHHKDHHQQSPKLARHFRCKMGMSQYTHERCLQVYGENYFDGVEIQYYQEGNCLTQWLGEDLNVIEVPGHDEGQLALMPSSRNWFLAGDLFQGIGTVVVGGEEGSMQKYMETLERVIALKPRCVIPSHGIALGGTHILEKILEHRIYRENQIELMAKEGLTREQMLKRIYFDIPENIHKYALANIDSHLKKLQDESRI